MKSYLPPFFLLSALVFGADTQWTLEKCTLAYHVTHPLHQIDGVSHEAKGKGICHEGQCRFLIAVPVKSFDSRDANRDLHMLQVVRGAQFPLITVRLTVPENPGSSVSSDVEIQFAGETKHYSVPLQIAAQDKEARVTTTIPATMSDFKIDPPTLLAMPCKNEIPVKVDITWRR